MTLSVLVPVGNAATLLDEALQEGEEINSTRHFESGALNYASPRSAEAWGLQDASRPSGCSRSVTQAIPKKSRKYVQNAPILLLPFRLTRAVIPREADPKRRFDRSLAPA
jgi:hypothetical protein